MGWCQHAQHVDTVPEVQLGRLDVTWHMQHTDTQEHVSSTCNQWQEKNTSGGTSGAQLRTHHFLYPHHRRVIIVQRGAVLVGRGHHNLQPSPIVVHRVHDHRGRETADW